MTFYVQRHAAMAIIDEGLDYAVQDYCSPETFADVPELEKLWRDAAIALGRLETYLVPFGFDELQDRTGDLKKLEAK